VTRLVLLATSRWLPPGRFSRIAWAVVLAGPVLCADAGEPQAEALRVQGVPVEAIGRLPADELVEVLRRRAAAADVATWLLTGVEDPLAVSLASHSGVEVLVDAGDPVGGQLLAAVATMDRLRSPAGCPWDAAQTHDSLAGYLLEEAYEAVGCIEDGDLDTGLAEELGDVLLQVLFHARIAAERRPAGFDIDTVAAGLVAKLTRRHPHVFARLADADRPDAAAVARSWEELKQEEKRRDSVLDGVPPGQPALAYAGAVLRRAARSGLALELAVEVEVGAEVEGEVAGSDAQPDPPEALAGFGRRLLAEAARCQAAGIDPEQALRWANRELAARVRDAEGAARLDGV
jgi:XTP/dITP diphosphohydrolase